MKLREYLGKLNPKTTVAIAPINGTGFVYIGDAGNIDMIELLCNQIVEDKRRLANDYKHKLEVTRIANDYDVRQWTRAVKRLESEIRNFVPYLEREVLMTRVKEVDPGLAVFVDGKETGKFWLKSEFDEYSRNLHLIL